MGYFPLCVDLNGKNVLLVGTGPQIGDKMEKLRPFGAVFLHCDDPTKLTLDDNTALVVVGDLGEGTAAEISRRCRERRIPVNVVDDPKNSTFCFPSLITRGDVTVSVSTGGKSPGGAAYLSRLISGMLPEDTGEIIDRLHALRTQLYADYPKEDAKLLLHEAVLQAFAPDASR